jgi:hypothetical protein
VTVKSLRHLRDLWKESCENVTTSSSEKRSTPSFVRIELEHDDDIVFEIQAAIDAEKEILKVYQIPKPSIINPPNPNYNLNTEMGSTSDHN